MLVAYELVDLAGMRRHNASDEIATDPGYS